MGRKKNKLVYGWGIVDVDYNVTRTEVENSKQKIVWRCPYYVKWCSILERCFSKNLHAKRPTYKGCTVTEEWKHLSNFIKWVDSQPIKDWMDCEADKDFLSAGNKHYSSETVIFVSRKVNGFILDRGKSRGDCMIGVNYYSNRKKKPYRASCGNPFSKKQEYLGCYPTELEAHLAWKARKHEYARHLADIQRDVRIAKRLKEMYSPDKDWTNK